MGLLEELDAKYPLEIKWLNQMTLPPPHAPPAVLFDKDSCYADTRHRQPMLPEIRAGRATWTDYYLAMEDDQPIAGTVRLLKLLDPAHLLLTVTGSGEEAFPLLKSWLVTHKVPMDGVVMRPAGDNSPNAVFKVRAVMWLQSLGYDVQLLVEDWAEVAQEVTERTGVPGLVVKTEYLADIKAEAGI